MKTLTAVVTALTVVGFASTAFAECMSSKRPAVDQTAEKPILILPQTAGS